MNLPKTCDPYREAMLSLGAAALTSTRRQELRELLTHIEQCPDCRRAAAEYEELLEVLGAGREQTGKMEPTGGWVAFEERMQTAVAGHSQRHEPMTEKSGPWEIRWRWRVAAALMLAAGLGIAAGIVLRPPGATSSVVAPGHPVDAAMVRMTAPELQQHVEAFDNISSVFDRRASWIMLADGGKQSDMGIAPERVDGQASPLVLRMVVRHAGGMADAAAQWEVVSQCDLVIVPGQTAELTVNSLDARRLNFRVQTDALNLHRVTLMLELGDSGGTRPGEDERGTKTAAGTAPRDLPRGMLATTLWLEFGNSATVGQIVTSGGVYSLAAGLDALPAATAHERENHL